MDNKKYYLVNNDSILYPYNNYCNNKIITESDEIIKDYTIFESYYYNNNLIKLD